MRETLRYLVLVVAFTHQLSCAPASRTFPPDGPGWRLLSQGSPEGSPGPRARSLMFVRNDEIYITGGNTGAVPPEGTFHEIFKYSLQTQVWTRHTVRGDVPPFTLMPARCWTGKYLYMFGGVELKEPKPWGDYPNDLYRYPFRRVDSSNPPWTTCSARGHTSASSPRTGGHGAYLPIVL